jgi:hypothetical protein
VGGVVLSVLLGFLQAASARAEQSPTTATTSQTLRIPSIRER